VKSQIKAKLFTKQLTACDVNDVTRYVPQFKYMKEREFYK